MSIEHGELAVFVDRHTLRYDRRYPHPIELVFEAVSTGEHLSVWLLPVTRVEQRLGGRATFTWGGAEADGVETAEVTVFDPPKSVAYTLEHKLPTVGDGDGDDGSARTTKGSMRFDLEPDGDDATILRFTLHWPVPDGVSFDSEDWPGGDLPAGPDTAWRPGQIAGFHTMLEDLAGFLDGTFDAADRQASFTDPAAAERHGRWIATYRPFIADTCPPR